MKYIIIIAIVVGIGAIVAILSVDYYIQNQTLGAKPWIGLSCDEMLDFSASEEHQDLAMDQHMEFHNYYYDRCSETELAKP